MKARRTLHGNEEAIVMDVVEIVPRRRNIRGDDEDECGGDSVVDDQVISFSLRTVNELFQAFQTFSTF